MVQCPALSNDWGTGNGLIDLLGLHLVCKSETMKGHFLAHSRGLPPTVCNLGILPGGKKTDLEGDSTQEHSLLRHTDPQRIPPPSLSLFFFFFSFS